MAYSTKSTLFNGSTQYGTAGDVFDFEYTDDFSISCWVKTTDTGGYFVCKQEVGSNLYRGYGLAMNASGVVDFHLRSNQATNNRIHVEATTSGLNDGSWHHLVATWKGNASPAASDLKLYIDGQLETPNVVVDNLSATILNDVSLNVAVREDGTDAFRAGNIDEVAIYDKELSAAEVAWICNAGNTRDLKDAAAPSNLVWWCRMGENGSATVLADEVGFGYPEYPPNTDPNLTQSLHVDPGDWRTGSYVYFGNVAATNFTPTDPFTIGIWMRTTDTGTGRGIPSGSNSKNIFSKCGFGGYNAYYAYERGGWRFYVYNNKVGVSFWSSYISDGIASQSYLTTETVDAVSYGEWHLLTATYDGSATQAGLKLFIDGVEVPFTTVGTGTLSGDSTSNYSLMAGSTGETTSDYYNIDALMRDSFVYDVELTPAEVALLFTDGRPQNLLSAAQSANLVHWCRLGDGCALGTNGCPDLSTLGNDGTIVVGTAVDFEANTPPPTNQVAYSPLSKSLLMNDGELDEYVTFGQVPGTNVELRPEVTMAAWVKTTTGVSGCVMIKHEASSRDGFMLYLEGGDRLQFYHMIGDNSGAGYISAYAPGIYDGEWHFIVGRFDGSQMRIYLDGVWLSSISSGWIQYGISADPTGELWVGGWKDGNAIREEYQGQVCHTAYWTKSVSQWEVIDLYGDGIPQDLNSVGPTSDLVHWCALGDGDAIGAGNMIDLSASATDGTMVNMAEDDFVEDAPFMTGDLPLTLVGSPTLPDDAPPGTGFDGSYEAPPAAEDSAFVKNAAGSAVSLDLDRTKIFPIETTFYYRMRGIDITCPDIQQPAYVYWVVEDTPDWLATLLSASDLPCGSDPSTDVVDINISGKWKHVG